MEAIRVTTADGSSTVYYFKELEVGQTIRIRLNEGKKKRGRPRKGAAVKPEVTLARPTAPLYPSPPPPGTPPKPSPAK